MEERKFCKRGHDWAEFGKLNTRGTQICKKCMSENSQKSVKSKLNWKEYRRNLRLRHMYGITLDELKTMLQEQNYKCGMCKDPIDLITLQIDHCHKTGKIRELLCVYCNSGLGYFKDCIERMKNGIDYLIRHKGINNVR